MANHKSALKRIRSNNKKRLRNRFQHKTARNAIRNLRELTTKEEAQTQLPVVVSLIEKYSNLLSVQKKKEQEKKKKLP